MSTLETFFITKYALTSGIFSVKAFVSERSTDMICVDGNTRAYYHGNDWHRTMSSAIERAEQMRKNRIKSLERAVAKAKAMTWDLKNEQ